MKDSEGYSISSDLSAKKNRRRHFTLLELLVSVVIIAILAGLLLAVLSQVREKGKSISCLNNVKTINVGIMGYVDNYHDYLPGGRINRVWWNVLFAQLKLVDTPIPAWNINGGMAQGVYACPCMNYDKIWDFGQEHAWNLWNTYKGCSYGLNRYMSKEHTEEERARNKWRRITSAKTPSRTYSVGDKWLPDRPDSAPPQMYIRARYYQPGERHSGLWNVAMLDGHAIHAKGYPCRGEKADFNAPEWKVY